MKKLLASLLLAVAPVAAAQNFYCDTVLTVGGQCGIWVDAGAQVTVNTVVIGGIQTCRYDVSALAVGAHTLKCSAIAVSDPTWGSQESAQSSMVYTKVLALPAPTNLKVGP